MPFVATSAPFLNTELGSSLNGSSSSSSSSSSNSSMGHSSLRSAKHESAGEIKEASTSAPGATATAQTSSSSSLRMFHPPTSLSELKQSLSQALSSDSGNAEGTTDKDEPATFPFLSAFTCPRTAPGTKDLSKQIVEDHHYVPAASCTVGSCEFSDTDADAYVVNKNNNNNNSIVDLDNSSAEEPEEQQQQQKQQQRQRQYDSEEEFQDAVITAGALVGETLMDAPSGEARPSPRTGKSLWRCGAEGNATHLREQTGGCAHEHQGHISSPSSTDSNNNNHNHHNGKVIRASDTTSTASRESYDEEDSNNPNPDENGNTLQPPRLESGQHTPPSRPEPKKSPPSPEHDLGFSVGIMAQGLAWVRIQREQRRRQYLHNQAEQQLLKIKQAQAEQKRRRDTDLAEFSVLHPRVSNSHDSNCTRSSSLLDNSTFQNLAAGVFLGGGSPKSATSPDKSTSSTQDAHSHAQHPHDHHIHHSKSGEHGQGPDNDNDVSKAAVVSQSGDGYSVQFSDDESGEEDETLNASFIPTVRVDMEGESDMTLNPFLLTADQMQQIACHVLPRGIAYAKWKRLYSLARDGDSFDVCLRFIAGHPKTLLVVRTSKNAILGGFADAPWEASSSQYHGPSYYGGPQTCLFSVDPATKKIQHYKWTGANRYFQLCDPAHKMLAFGGGGADGSFALAVAHDFQSGSTGPTVTFENKEPLTAERNFHIVDVEIFGFLTGQF